MTYQQGYQSPFGDLLIRANGNAITEIKFESSNLEKKGDLTQKAISQLDEFFKLGRKVFDLPLEPAGTQFQQAIWAQLIKIPISETRSYGELARFVGKPKACRAVGGAVGANPIAIVIPCHRVIGTDGKITGYSGGEGVKTKVSLLELESATVESTV